MDIDGAVQEAEIAARVEGKMSSAECQELVESEVTASVVGEALKSGAFLKKYAKLSEESGGMLKRIGRFLKGIVTALKDKDESASREAHELMKRIDRALASEVEGENTGTKYNADNKVRSFSKIAVSMALYDALDHKDKGYDNLILMNKMPRFIEDDLGAFMLIEE